MLQHPPLKKISIVVPSFNESANIEPLVDQISVVFVHLNYDYEFIFVNDRSSDDTQQTLLELNKKNPRVNYIEFSRNFGHQLAVKAGMDYAYSDCVITLDCDMQHPPQLFHEMIAKWEAGYDVIYTCRQDDKNLSKRKRFTSALFYKILNAISDINLEPGSADFRLLDQKIVNIFRTFHENEPFLRGLVKWIGFKQYLIPYKAQDRHTGESKYTTKKMVRLALQGITSFSVRPLYAAVYLGFLFSLLSLLYIPYIIYSFYVGAEVHGWASVLMSIVFFGGLQLIILGIIGIYIGKLFIQAKQRPNYIVRNATLKKNGS